MKNDRNLQKYSSEQLKEELMRRGEIVTPLERETITIGVSMLMEELEQEWHRENKIGGKRDYACQC